MDKKCNAQLKRGLEENAREYCVIRCSNERQEEIINILNKIKVLTDEFEGLTQLDAICCARLLNYNNESTANEITNL